jgi:hypothetical protein
VTRPREDSRPPGGDRLRILVHARQRATRPGAEVAGVELDGRPGLGPAAAAVSRHRAAVLVSTSNRWGRAADRTRASATARSSNGSSARNAAARLAVVGACRTSSKRLTSAFGGSRGCDGCLLRRDLLGMARPGRWWAGAARGPDSLISARPAFQPRGRGFVGLAPRSQWHDRPGLAPGSSLRLVQWHPGRDPGTRATAAGFATASP